MPVPTEENEGRKKFRPPSGQLSELHIYIIPVDLYRHHLKSASNSVIDKTISLGFVRVPADLSLHNLRDEIHRQLSYEEISLPRDYLFLKSVGRCLTKVKSRQEYNMKVRHFLPPLAYLPEIFVLEALPEFRDSGGNVGGTSRSSSDSEVGWNGCGGNRHRVIPPIRNNHNATPTGFLPPVSATPPRSASTPPMRYVDEDAERRRLEELRRLREEEERRRRAELEELERLRRLRDEQEEKIRLLELSSSQPHTISEQHSDNVNVVNSSTNTSKKVKEVIINPDTKQNKNDDGNYNDNNNDNNKKKKKNKNSQSSTDKIKTNTAPALTILPDNNNENTITKEPDQQSISRIENKNNNNNNSNKKVSATDTDKTKLKIPVVIDKDEKDKNSTRPAMNIIPSKSNKKPPKKKQITDDTKAINSNKKNNEQQQAQQNNKNNNNSELMTVIDKENEHGKNVVEERKTPSPPPRPPTPVQPPQDLSEKNRLLSLLHKIRQERIELEKKREELMRKCKHLQSRAANRRNHAKEIWKKKYYEQKKKTTPIEEKCGRLKNDLDSLHRRLMNQMENREKDSKKFNTEKPSEEMNLRMQASRIQHTIDSLQTQIENLKMRLTTEMKLRHQAETEQRAIKAELIQKKINVNLTRNHQLDQLQSNRTPVPTAR